MMFKSTSALLFQLLQLSQLVVGQNEEGPSETWDITGDCLGVGPSYGLVGSYIQSDMQFAQQVRQDIRTYGTSMKGKIDGDIDMNVYARFFIY